MENFRIGIPDFSPSEDSVAGQPRPNPKSTPETLFVSSDFVLNDYQFNKSLRWSLRLITNTFGLVIQWVG